MQAYLLLDEAKSKYPQEQGQCIDLDVVLRHLECAMKVADATMSLHHTEQHRRKRMLHRITQELGAHFGQQTAVLVGRELELDPSCSEEVRVTSSIILTKCICDIVFIFPCYYVCVCVYCSRFSFFFSSKL